MFKRRFGRFGGRRRGPFGGWGEGHGPGRVAWGEGHGRHGPWERHGEGFRFAPGGGWGRGFDRPEDDDDSFGGGDPRRGRKRARRGDIKLVLLALVAEKPRHGYELIKELEQRYAGFYRPSPGSVYPTLQYLEDEGHLTSATEDGKRIYTITDAGRQWLEEHGRDVADAGVRGGRRGGPVHDERFGLRQRMMALMGGVQQVARHGSREQMQEALAILDGAAQAIYGVLAGKRPEGAEERDA